MGRRTDLGLTNAIKELEALKVLVFSGKFSLEELTEFIDEVSWQLAGLLRGWEYDSDEFQMILAKLVKGSKCPP